MTSRKMRMSVLLSVAFIAAAMLIVRGAMPTPVNNGGNDSPSIQFVQVQQRLAAPFDLSDLSIPADEIRGGGPPKDGIPAITNPNVVKAADARILQLTDRVIGVSIKGQSRAYPISILTQHEIVNDRLADVPIAVTYCPLCDSVLVFDRRTALGEKEFGVSGLLYNSNVLMYDRSEKESLWSQMMMEGVSGLAKGTKLKALPMELTSWGSWQTRHPETDVLSLQTGYQRDYRRNPYFNYFRQPGLMFPARPRSNALPLKEPVVAIWDEQESVVVPASHFQGQPGIYAGVLNGKPFKVQYEPTIGSLRVLPTEEELSWANAFWFAWHAFHPTTKIGQK